MNGHFQIFDHVFQLIVGLLFAIGLKWFGKEYSDRRRTVLRIIGALIVLLNVVQIAFDLKIF
jgi:multisubunit Na+/H+ antiporter MnhE subunit